MFESYVIFASAKAICKWRIDSKMFESYVIFASAKAMSNDTLNYPLFESYVIFASNKALDLNRYIIKTAYKLISIAICFS